MHKRIMMPIAIVATMLMATMSAAVVGAIHDNDGETHDFAHEAFEATWNRTDLPVESGQVSRTWIWGTIYTDGMMEDYAESPDGERLVQYFDKSRMEINDPEASDDDLWFVTNGLLVVEMVEGWYQTGDATFDNSPDPAEVNIVGDPADDTGLGPTYADINTFGLRELPAAAEGTAITATIDGNGVISSDPSLAGHNVTAAERVTVTGIDHTVASVFWDFMNSSGTVWEAGQFVTEDLFENAFYATGYPITEAYWSSAMVAGTERDVLWQCFERRCLTYTPGNSAGFLVEAGNVGQHYYRWRYETEAPATPTPEPTTTPTEMPTETPDASPTGTSTATATATGTTTPTSTATATGTATPGTEVYVARFDDVNLTGVGGTIRLTLKGDALRIEINAQGLSPNRKHMVTLFGVDNADPTCPVNNDDTDGNGLVDLDEAMSFFGQRALLVGEFMADADGDLILDITVEYDRDELPALDDLVVVVHGLLVESDDDVVIYLTDTPVGCGSILLDD